MDIQNFKCILIIDQQLSTGMKTNVASILSISVGNKLGRMIGPDLIDSSGVVHPGLTQLPIPVLGASAAEISSIRQDFIERKDEADVWIGFSTLAQQAHTYEDYTTNLQAVDAKEIVYLGIALFGNKKKVNKATKGLSLIS